MLHQILEANGGLPKRVKVLFQNTGRELPETMDFIQECSRKWGVGVVWLEYDVAPDGKPTFDIVSRESADMVGKPFDRLIDKYGALPRAGGRYCTGELKMDTARRYLKSIGWDKWHNCLGIRADEPKRVKPNKRGYMTNWHPVYDAGHTNNDVMEFWSKQDFDLRLPVVNGRTISGNCDFCFLKSEAALSYMYREYPERAQWWIDAEKRTGRSFHPGRPIGQLVDFIDRQGDWIFDDEDFLCQANDGECTG
jgi:3'-phosphoadenosine 5'-phosphosulfate sulfotransferase (PAPS reductase)/FAD synthetase